MSLVVYTVVHLTWANIYITFYLWHCQIQFALKSGGSGKGAEVNGGNSSKECLPPEEAELVKACYIELQDVIKAIAQSLNVKNYTSLMNLQVIYANIIPHIIRRLA